MRPRKRFVKRDLRSGGHLERNGPAGTSSPQTEYGRLHCDTTAVMRAMVFERVGGPLALVERPVPEAGPGQLVVRVLACGVCRPDLHLLDGEVAIREFPRVLGHQIVGEAPDGSLVGI